MNEIPQRAKMFILAVILIASSLTVYAIGTGLGAEVRTFLVLLSMAIVAARLKLALPGFESNMSMNLPFMLLAISQLSLPNAIAVGAISAFVQTLPRSGQVLKPAQVMFNVCHMVNAIAISSMLASRAGSLTHVSTPLLISAGAFAFFLADTVPVAAIIAMTSGSRFVEGWTSIALMTFPHFVLSAGLACIVATGVRVVGWSAGAIMLIVMLGVFRSFQCYFRRVGRVGQTVVLQEAAAAD